MVARMRLNGCHIWAELECMLCPSDILVAPRGTQNTLYTIRWLQNFNAKVFQAAHAAELLVEDNQLNALDADTQKWWEMIGWRWKDQP